MRTTSHAQMITVDGSAGEGGGQVLRTSLSLALVTGKPFCIENIRAGRRKPGLRSQHLTAVHAAAEIGRATVEGAAIGSKRLTFAPKSVRPGEYRFSVGTAGSATLVFQTVLPALMTADGPSKLLLEGGTHNPWAPPFDFLQKAFLPIVRRMGPKVEVTLTQHGFYPAGSGAFTAEIQPGPRLGQIDLRERGDVLDCHVRAIVSRLPLTIAERELHVIEDRTSWPEERFTAERVDSRGPGNCVMIEVEGQHVTEVFTGFGQKGVPAETVAGRVVERAQRYLAAGVPVGQHLADQLLIPLGLAGGGSFRTLPPSAHTTTNVEVLQRFLDLNVRSEEVSSDVWQISIDELS